MILLGSRATLKLSARFQPSVSGLLTTRVAPSVTAFIGLALITAYKGRCCSRSYETRRPVPDERGNRMDNIGRPACSAGVRNNFLSRRERNVSECGHSTMVVFSR